MRFWNVFVFLVLLSSGAFADEEIFGTLTMSQEVVRGTSTIEGKLSVGTTEVRSTLGVKGTIESFGVGGVKFPDGTIQITAADTTYVNSVASQGATGITGDVHIKGGGRTVVTQSGQTIEVSSPSLEGSALTSLASQGATPLTGTVEVKAGTGVSVSQSNEVITVNITGGGANDWETANHHFTGSNTFEGLVNVKGELMGCRETFTFVLSAFGTADSQLNVSDVSGSIDVGYVMMRAGSCTGISVRANSGVGTGPCYVTYEAQVFSSVGVLTSVITSDVLTFTTTNQLLKAWHVKSRTSAIHFDQFDILSMRRRVKTTTLTVGLQVGNVEVVYDN